LIYTPVPTLSVLHFFCGDWRGFRITRFQVAYRKVGVQIPSACP
jgi:hypothetical protein